MPFSAWLAGDVDHAVVLFVNVLKRLEDLPNTKSDIPSFRVGKVVGQMLIHIEHAALGVHDEGAYAPRAGAGSNPEASDKWLELPVSSSDQLWLLLAQTEAALHLTPRVFTEFRTRLRQSTLPTVRWFGTELEVKHTIRSGEFSNLPVLAQEMARVNRLVFGNQFIRDEPVEVANEALLNGLAELGDFAVAEQVLVAGLLSIGERGASTLGIWNVGARQLVGS